MHRHHGAQVGKEHCEEDTERKTGLVVAALKDDGALAVDADGPWVRGSFHRGLASPNEHHGHLERLESLQVGRSQAVP